MIGVVSLTSQSGMTMVRRGGEGEVGMREGINIFLYKTVYFYAVQEIVYHKIKLFQMMRERSSYFHNV